MISPSSILIYLEWSSRHLNESHLFSEGHPLWSEFSFASLIAANKKTSKHGSRSINRRLPNHRRILRFKNIRLFNNLNISQTSPGTPTRFLFLYYLRKTILSLNFSTDLETIFSPQKCKTGKNVGIDVQTMNI